MVCYVVPTAVLVLGLALRRKYNWNTLYAQWFTMLFAGGVVFGVVDHVWNGELFLIGGSIAGDLLLGLAITLVLLAVWVVLVSLDAAKKPSASKT